MLAGREEALSILDRLRKDESFQLVVVYGKRGVGKSTLLREFASSMESIFFICGDVNSTLMLQSFSKILLSHFKAQERFENFDSWKKALRFIPYMEEDKSVLIVIEDYMNLFSAVPSFALTLKKLIESELSDSKLFVVLSGSSLDFKRSGLAGGENPLSKCLTACIEVRPLDYLQTSRWFGGLSREEIITAYGILGGMPGYLAKWDGQLSIEENIGKNFLDPSSFLYNESQMILRSELREPRLYNSILQVIAAGANRLSDIASAIAEPSDKTAKYIATLIDIDILVRDIPVTEEARSRKAVYRIRDDLLRFWYTFIFPNLAIIESGKGEELVHDRILPRLEKYLHQTFVKICTQYLRSTKDTGQLEGEIERIGGWWTNDLEGDGSIDILCTGRDSLIACDCYWQREVIGIDSLERLVVKARKIKSRNKRYMLFSRSGFDKELREHTLSNAKVTLVDLRELFELDAKR